MPPPEIERPLAPQLVPVVMEYVRGSADHLAALAAGQPVPLTDELGRVLTDGAVSYQAALASFFTTGMEVGVAFALRYPVSARRMFPPPPHPDHQAELEDSVLRLGGSPVGRA